MRTKAFVLALAAATLALASGVANGDGGGPSPGSEMGWTGITARSGKARFVALPGQRQTIVAAVRVRGGVISRWGVVPGVFGIPMVAFDGSKDGLSGDGKRLVLSTPTPNPGPNSAFPILATNNLRVVRTVVLRGSWAYDAISPDASRLYLVEYLATGLDPRYRVRAFDLVAGRLIPGAIVDRREEEAVMRGQPATRAWSTDRRWAYTLYARQGQPPFVHALDTVRGVAFLHRPAAAARSTEADGTPSARELERRPRRAARPFHTGSRGHRHAHGTKGLGHLGSGPAGCRDSADALADPPDSVREMPHSNTLAAAGCPARLEDSR